VYHNLSGFRLYKNNLKENDAAGLVKGKYGKRSDNVISGFSGLKG
jgi:hypothetical protein